MEIQDFAMQNDGEKSIVNNWIDEEADILSWICKTVAPASYCPYP